MYRKSSIYLCNTSHEVLGSQAFDALSLMTPMLKSPRRSVVNVPAAKKLPGPVLKGGIGQKFDLDALSRAGQVYDRGGLTKAGRALDKHGNRLGSVFPKAIGNPLSKNMQGQYHLDDILTDPKGFSKLNNFGGIDFYRQDGAGIRFYKDETFRGFLEPN